MISNDQNEQEINKPLDIEDVLSGAEERQRKIRNALLILDTQTPQLSKRLAGIYEGMVLTSGIKRNPDRIAQVSHSARELTAILPRYFKGIPIPETDQDIAKESANIARQRGILKDLLNKHPDRSSLPDYLRDKFVDDWMEVNDYFIKSSKHEDLRNQKVSEISEKEFEAQLWRYEDLLCQVLVERTFFDGLSEIDKLLKIAAPTKDDTGELAKNISQPQHRRYFFQKCVNPQWLRLLKEIGAFSNPQPVQREGGYIRFLGWPESQYLSRVATDEPAEVFEIIKDLDSENQSVLDDFIDAAIKSPVEIASKYVDLIVKKKWIQNTYNLRLPDKIAELMEKLAEGNAMGGALKLARVLFDTKVDPPTKLSDDSEKPFSTVWHDAKPYFDEWRLGEIVKKKIKSLSAKDPKGLFDIYSSCLRQALELEKRAKTDEGFYDYSHIWRPNLGRARNSREDAKNILLGGLINLIDGQKDNQAILESFISSLRKHPLGLFRRVEIYLYLNSTVSFKKEVEELLSDKQTITAYNLRREYLPLLGKEFQNLSSSAQEKIIEIINEGPDIKKTDEMTEEQFARIKEDWKALYLSPIKKSLPYKEEKFYGQVVAKRGEPEVDDGEIHTWSGGQSPINAEELGKKSAEEVLAYLMDYQIPKDPFDRYSSTGLGMVFANIVAEEPSKYIPLAVQFTARKVRPIYIYHFINGLKEALKQDRCFEWAPVIDLFHHLTLKLDDVKKVSLPANRDEQDWDSVLRTISDVLGHALGQNKCEIPPEFKEKIWKIIVSLSENPEPTPEYEKRDGEGGLDPMTLAINTVRGEAMHAVINYGLWFARNCAKKEDEVKAPEYVTALLDKHLNTTNDPSLAIRSVYGWRVPNLFYLNKFWLENNKENIFPKDAPEYLLAAWEGYLANNVIKEVFTMLKQQYTEFIPYLNNFEKRGYRAADIDQRFPQHAMIVYANEPDHDDFTTKFFDSAPAKARAEAINFGGRVILRQLETLSDKERARKRLEDLWKSRVDSNADPEELMEFGWWFKNSPMQRKDTLDQMIKTLKATRGKIDVPYEIIEELVGCATEHPVESITILDQIARSESESHEVSYKKEEYRQIIRLVKKTKNTEATKIADALINHLGSRGFIDDFRDLL